jgi:hypothetical protein
MVTADTVNNVTPDKYKLSTVVCLKADARLAKLTIRVNVFLEQLAVMVTTVSKAISMDMATQVITDTVAVAESVQRSVDSSTIILVVTKS